MTKDKLKLEVWQACSKIISQKRELLDAEMLAVREAGANESKSTAGDKHETGKAMAQLEQENLGKQMLHINQLQKVLDSLDPNKGNKKVESGALIQTQNMTLFVGPALGQIEVESKVVFCVSTASPLVKQLWHREVGEEINFNGKNVKIKSIQ